MERINKNRHEVELFESEDKLAKVWNNYEKIVKKYPDIVIVDGNRPVEKVHQDIVKEVEKML